MRHHISTILAPLTIGLAVMLGADAASAAEDRVLVYGPLPCTICGDYVQTGDSYEGNPVYVLETDANLQLYRRLDGVWYIDSDEVDEQLSGTLAIGPNADTPYDGSWNLGGLGATPSDVVHVAGNTYSNLTTGTFLFEGDLHNGKPVYVYESGGITWSLYQRSSGYAAGAWVIDFNDVDEQWDGTVIYGNTATDWPWEATFNDDTAATAIDEVSVADAPYSNSSTGIYTFSFESYNGKPVYVYESGGTTWSLYQRSEGYAAGAWVIDFNDVDDQWDGTITYGLAAADWPWETTFNGSTTVEAIEN